MENLPLLTARAFCAISFVFFNYVGFSYIEKVLSKVRLHKYMKLGMSIVNTGLYLVLSSTGVSLSLVYLGGYLTIILEFLLIYKVNLRSVLYVASTFMLNIVAVRNIVLSVVSVTTNLPMYQISGNNTVYNLSLFVSFFILDILMLFFQNEKIVTFQDLVTFSHMKMQETFVAITSLVILIYLLAFSSTHYYNVEAVSLAILNFMTPVILLFLYYLTFSFAIKVSKTIDTERRSRELEKELMETEVAKVQFENMAYLDSLTSVFNRRYCIDKLIELKELGQSFSLCFVDLDKLKAVNDQFGHAEGDEYIKACVETLSRAFRKNDIISRVGGDEFVIILPNCPKGVAQEKVSVAYNDVKALCKDKHLQYETSISFGIIEVPKNTNMEINEMLHAADELMYEFKLSHRKKA